MDWSDKIRIDREDCNTFSKFVNKISTVITLVGFGLNIGSVSLLRPPPTFGGRVEKMVVALSSPRHHVQQGLPGFEFPHVTHALFEFLVHPLASFDP